MRILGQPTWFRRTRTEEEWIEDCRDHKVVLSAKIGIAIDGRKFWLHDWKRCDSRQERLQRIMPPL
jgi:hypothetical protein